MKRFKILCTLLLVCFFVALFQNSVLSFIQGFDLGYNVAIFEDENQVKTQSFTEVKLTPKSSELMLNDTNRLDGSAMALVPSKASVITLKQNATENSVLENILHVVNLVVLLLIVVGYLYILVIFVKVIVSFQRSEVFTERNIRQVNIIGIGFIALAVLSTIYSTIDYCEVSAAVEFANYDISATEIVDWDDFIIGLVILLMNEILRKATHMKHEQDLTI